MTLQRVLTVGLFPIWGPAFVLGVLVKATVIGFLAGYRIVKSSD